VCPRRACETNRLRLPGHLPFPPSLLPRGAPVVYDSEGVGRRVKATGCRDEVLCEMLLCVCSNN
jgi:hypothetical protein